MQKIKSGITNRNIVNFGLRILSWSAYFNIISEHCCNDFISIAASYQRGKPKFNNHFVRMGCCFSKKKKDTSETKYVQKEPEAVVIGNFCIIKTIAIVFHVFIKKC